MTSGSDIPGWQREPEGGEGYQAMIQGDRWFVARQRVKERYPLLPHGAEDYS